MRSPSSYSRAVSLFYHELRRLLTGRAYWTMTLLLSPLAGYGFIQAVRLFGQASRTALEFPELARGMSPLDGVLVPTFGAFYLGTTLLFPFVAIRALGQDKESGALKLALQWPMSATTLVSVKLLAVGTAWLLTLIIPVSALVLWSLAGGHLAFPETANLFLGHALYALAVAGIAFLAAAATESAATAAIVTLAFTLGFWVLDFAAAAGPAWLMALGEISPTQALKQFERGVLSVPHALGLAALGLGSVAIAISVLHPGHTRRRKVGRSLVAGLVLAAALASASLAHVARDVSDDRRNSFNAADEIALASMDQELTITIHLSRGDSRAREFSSNMLDKLGRTVSDLEVRWAEVDDVGPFAAAQDEQYGLIVYEYAGRQAESRSNSPREILPLLHELAGTRVSSVETRRYSGYPLVADVDAAAIWFYGLLPILLLFGAWRVARPARLPSHLRGLSR